LDIKTSDYDKSNVNRLLKALNHQEPDRLPHIELWVTSQAVYEYVLGRKLPYVIGDAAEGGQSITPEDDVEFAQRLGQDAVLCNFNWRPNNVFQKAEDGTRHYVNGSIKTLADLDRLEPPTPIDEQLHHLERYLTAAQGTGVGIIPNLTSFFDSAMLAIGVTDSLYMFCDNRPLVEKLMDILLDHQEKVMQAVCDRFANDIALVMVNDDIGYNSGLLIRPSMFMEIFPHRMKRLIAPAKACGKQVLMHTDGKLDTILPILYEVGINANHPVEPESNDLATVKKKWAGKMSFFGNVHTPLLAYGTREQIEAKVKEYCETVAPGGGYVLGSSTSIMDGIPPENFVAMTETVHKYGRYGSLGAAV
jgi:uroporphyrinogen decarboxylase